MITLKSASFASTVKVAVVAVGPCTEFGLMANATEATTALIGIVSENGVPITTVAVPVPVPSRWPVPFTLS